MWWLAIFECRYFFGAWSTALLLGVGLYLGAECGGAYKTYR